MITRSAPPGTAPRLVFFFCALCLASSAEWGPRERAKEALLREQRGLRGALEQKILDPSTQLPPGSYADSCKKCTLSGHGRGSRLRCARCEDAPFVRKSELYYLRDCQKDEWIVNSHGRLGCQKRPASDESTISNLRANGQDFAAESLEWIATEAYDL